MDGSIISGHATQPRQLHATRGAITLQDCCSRTHARWARAPKHQGNVVGRTHAGSTRVLLESRPTRESEVVEDSTRTADNSEAHVTLAHLCRPTHTQTPTRTQNASAEYDKRLRKLRALHSILAYQPSANLPTTMMVRQPCTSLHFPGLGLWRGAPAAPGRAWCTADRRCHLVALRPRSW